MGLILNGKEGLTINMEEIKFIYLKDDVLLAIQLIEKNFKHFENSIIHYHIGEMSITLDSLDDFIPVEIQYNNDIMKAYYGDWLIINKNTKNRLIFKKYIFESFERLIKNKISSYKKEELNKHIQDFFFTSFTFPIIRLSCPTSIANEIQPITLPVGEGETITSRDLEFYDYSYDYG